MTIESKMSTENIFHSMYDLIKLWDWKDPPYRMEKEKIIKLEL